MRRSRTLLTLLITLFCIGFGVRVAWGQGLIDDRLLCAEKASLGQRIQLRNKVVPYHSYQVDYHACYWSVFPKRNGYLTGSVRTQFTMLRRSDTVGFDLNSSLQVDSVKKGGMHVPFTHIGNVIYCKKAGGWNSAEKDTLEIFYQGNPIAGGGFGYYVYDFHARGPVVHTLSQPYGAPYWWPCKQSLNDKIDSIDIFITTHSDFKAGSNGKLISNALINDSQRVFHWKHRYPVATYLVAMAVSNYAEFTDYAKFHDRSDSLPVLNYVFPQFENSYRAAAAETLPMLRLFDSLFGEYPFMKEKYGHAQFTWGGGMEHQTMSFMVDLNYNLVAHELAHQWFGDKVTCGSWADLWLNEGFATYLNALVYRYLRPKSEWLLTLNDIRKDVVSQDGGSVYATDTQTVNVLFSGRLRYNKAAFVLHMLREQVGDSVFFSALRKYLADEDHAYAFARTAQLQQFMEEESGQNLDTFFTRWVYGEGFPYLKITWKQKGNQVKVHVSQRPSHPTVPYYILKLPLQFEGLNGSEQMVTLRNDQLEQDYTFEIPFPLKQVVFDPEVTVLSKWSIGGLNLDSVQRLPIEIGPNPVRQELQIFTSNIRPERLVVTDMAGREVMQATIDSTSLSDIIKVDVSQLAPGAYFLRVYAFDFVNLYKLIKE